MLDNLLDLGREYLAKALLFVSAHKTEVAIAVLAFFVLASIFVWSMAIISGEYDKDTERAWRKRKREKKAEAST